MTEEKWDSFFEDVKKYVGYSPTKNPCHGCQTPTENLSKDVGVHNFLRGCSARKCAFHNEIRNCAYCSRYPCDKIQLMNVANTREDAEARIGEPIPDDKYLAYVRIFEGMKNLDEIRSGLSNDQIVEVKKVERKQPRITQFPEVGKKHQKFKALHDGLTSIISSDLGLKDTDTLAVKELLKERRAVLLRSLWIAANFGELKDGSLVVDSISINTHKKGTSGFPTSEGGWRRWIDNLSHVGIKGEMILAPLDKSELTSPIGWLRERIPGTDDPVWHLKVTFDSKHGGPESVKMLQAYAQLLTDEYDRKAYSRFVKADMRLFET
jgi:hypothetical protein